MQPAVCLAVFRTIARTPNWKLLLDDVSVIMNIGKRHHDHLLLSSRLLDLSRVVPASIKLFIAATVLMYTLTCIQSVALFPTERKQVWSGQVDAQRSSSVNNKACDTCMHAMLKHALPCKTRHTIRACASEACTPCVTTA